MDLAVLIFLSSGLFLGWSLGANDAANVFGTAVGTRMVRFTTAALVCSLFVILGAVISGAGAASTLGRLGSVNAIGGAFMAALSAALTVYWMTKAGLPVSTSQAIVGAIIGWNLYSGSITDLGLLTTILATWVACPLLAGLIAGPLYKLTRMYLRRAKFHLLRLDAYTRVALILADAFGAYSLGANNIANVMGVFVTVSPFTEFSFAGLFDVSGIQQLFFLGAVAIAVGVFTYSKRVMLTVGNDLMPLSPVAAWVAVVAHSIVLFLFASEGLEQLLANANLPTIPLVPVSSSQAVVGAVIGIGIIKGGKGIQWRVLGSIGVGWVTTPIISAALCFVALFFVQNVFKQEVYKEVRFRVTPPVVQKLSEMGIAAREVGGLQGKEFTSAVTFREALRERTPLPSVQEAAVIRLAEISFVAVTETGLKTVDGDRMTAGQLAALEGISGQVYPYKWMAAEALARQSAEWSLRPETKAKRLYNKRITEKLDYVFRTFAVTE